MHNEQQINPNTTMRGDISRVDPQPLMATIHERDVVVKIDEEQFDEITFWLRYIFYALCGLIIFVAAK